VMTTGSLPRTSGAIVSTDDIRRRRLLVTALGFLQLELRAREVCTDRGPDQGRACFT